MKIKKVLILTANYGDGHIKTAASISNELKRQEPSVEVTTINLFQQAHPVINNVIKTLYLKCYSRIPQLYGFLYYSTKDIRRNFYLNNIIGMFGKKTLKKYLEEIKPDVVINTYPVLAMPILYKKGKTQIPCYTVITDYGIHSQWIDPGVLKYFVGSESIKEEITQQGVAPDKIIVTGIPVCIECETVDMNLFRNKYGLVNSELPIVTVLAGANGVLTNLDTTCRTLYSMKPEAQFIIVCGKNKNLKENLEIATQKYRDRIKIFGFVDNLHEVMKGSDIVVSKAGGITTTEALNIGVPLIVYGSPAGQEKENTKFLLIKRCAHHASNINQLAEILAKLLNDKSILEQMKESTSIVSKPNGCTDLVKHILKDLNDQHNTEEPIGIKN